MESNLGALAREHVIGEEEVSVVGEKMKKCWFGRATEGI